MDIRADANIKAGDYRKLARVLTIVENNLPGSEEILKALTISSEVPVIGITGPPGAGKSTLVNALIKKLTHEKRIAVIAVDPTSPFSHGSLLGDRIRMKEQFNNQSVFIRSIATRGSLGGLSVKTIEMVDVLKASAFDFILIETVGVGQSEVEVAKWADLTIVVLVPESGDEIQSIKSGLMEIANIFVVNKADRPGSEIFVNTIKKLVHQNGQQIPVLKTVANKDEGIDQLAAYIGENIYQKHTRKDFLLVEKAWKLIQEKRMAGIDKKKLQQEISNASQKTDFNLYSFVDGYIKNS